MSRVTKAMKSRGRPSHRRARVLRLRALRPSFGPVTFYLNGIRLGTVKSVTYGFRKSCENAGMTFEPVKTEPFART